MYEWCENFITVRGLIQFTDLDVKVFCGFTSEMVELTRVNLTNVNSN